jgi:hypothetical protein
MQRASDRVAATGRQFKSMIQQRITSRTIPRLLYQLENAPFINDRDLLFYVSHKRPSRYFRRHVRVPVEKIISAPHVENWGRVKDHRRTDEYIAKMAHAMATGRLDLDALPPVLQEHGGAYYVTSDGITRCALAKLLGMEYIPADVTYIQSPLNCAGGSPDEYKTLLDRRQQGLWRGTMTTYHTRSRIPFFRRFISAVGDVTSYEGVWVFAKHVQQAKEVYRKVGASGKPIFSETEPVPDMNDATSGVGFCTGL